MKTTPRTTITNNVGRTPRTRGAAIIGGTANLSPKNGTPFVSAARGPRPNSFYKTNR